jgi:hypothetical protein
MPRFIIQFFLALSIPLLIGFIYPGMLITENGEPAVSEILYDYPDHIPGAYTGGFGEQTCHSCHFDYQVNEPRGSLSVEGPDSTYSPSTSYDFTLTLQSERLEIGGFQMTARFEDGSQAGQFIWDGDHLTFTPATVDSIHYLQHEGMGANLTSDGVISWSFTWIAPDDNNRPVIINIAANAGNHDLSAFGDWIYLKERTLLPD